MGILPMGSGNDFVKLFGKGLTHHDYLNIICSGDSQSFDLISINGSSYCINTYGIGFDGFANKVASEIKIPLGRLKYLYAALKSLIAVSSSEFSIQIDDREELSISSYMIVISNGKWEGGTFKISPNSDPKDGLVEMTISTSKNKWGLLNQIIRLTAGKDLNPKESMRLTFKAAKIRLEKAIVSHSDGEVQKPLSNLEFEVMPKAVNILTPIN
jgi:diacylglycerol kinase family enzyme